MKLNKDGTIEIQNTTFKITEIKVNEMTIEAISGFFTGQTLKIPNTGKDISTDVLSIIKRKCRI
tara:strand:- start:564 stop:755 length:192 start_codon:yes stop_codon:yes gene_type:complete